MSKILDAVIETAHDLYDAEVMDEITMRGFEALKLPPIKQYTAEQIKHMRKKTR